MTIKSVKEYKISDLRLTFGLKMMWSRYLPHPSFVPLAGTEIARVKGGFQWNTFNIILQCIGRKTI
jgi:hypothetical protein